MLYSIIQQLPSRRIYEKSLKGVNSLSDFPSLFSFSRSSSSSSPADNFPPIAFPTADLDPITIEFADPSLRNYPDPSVPSAAVQSIREGEIKEEASIPRRPRQSLAFAYLLRSRRQAERRQQRPAAEVAADAVAQEEKSSLS